jgi:hypothetical protein
MIVLYSGLPTHKFIPGWCHFFIRSASWLSTPVSALMALDLSSKDRFIPSDKPSDNKEITLTMFMGSNKHLSTM